MVVLVKGHFSTRNLTRIDWKNDDVAYKCHPHECANFTYTYKISLSHGDTVEEFRI